MPVHAALWSSSSRAHRAKAADCRLLFTESTSLDDQPSLTEQLARELLHDRKAERRKTYFKYGVIAFAALLFFTAGGASNGSLPDSSNPYAALIKVTGEIGPASPSSAEVLNPLLEEAFEDPNAKAVVLLVNSPGGTPVQSSLIHDRIKMLRAQHPDKQVVAVGQDLMASGAYMIASAADRIVVNRSTVVGSIGVISRSFGFTGVMDKLGVERRVQAAGGLKNSGDPFSAQTTEERDRTAALLTKIHAHFIDTVKSGRGARLRMETPDLFSGKVWTGSEAVTIGLADSLGDLSSVKKSLGVTRLHEFAPPATLLNTLVGQVATETAAAVSAQLSSNAPVPMALYAR